MNVPHTHTPKREVILRSITLTPLDPRVVLLVYDYTLTFSMEVERFWLSHQASTTTILYFVNRYVGLVGYLPILYQFLSVTTGDVRDSTPTPHSTPPLTFASPTGVSVIGRSTI